MPKIDSVGEKKAKYRGPEIWCPVRGKYVPLTLEEINRRWPGNERENAEEWRRMMREMREAS